MPRKQLRRAPQAAPDAVTPSGRALDPDRPPTDPGELHTLLRETLEIDVPRRPMLSGSTAPFDYLVHTFFEGRPFTPDGAEAPGPWSPADAVVWANRGGGKTFYGAVATFLDLVYKPGVQVRILGGSLDQSRRMYAHLRALFAKPCAEGLLDGKPTARRIALINTSAVEILAQSETSVRGTRVQKLRCDEVELFDADIWRAAQLTTRSLRLTGPWGAWVRGGVEALSTMHKPFGIMWRLVGEAGGAVVLASEDAAPETAPHAHDPSRERPKRRLFRWGVVDVLAECEPRRPCDGCALHEECAGRAKRAPGEAAGAPRGHIEIEDALALKSRVDTAAWKTEMLCLSPRRSDSVYPEFRRDVHVYDDHAPFPPAAPPPGRLICGMDFGFRSPTVILWGSLADDGMLRIFAERHLRESRLEEHIAALTDGAGGPGAMGLPRPEWIGVDPAGRQRSDQSGRSNVELMQSAGLSARWRNLELQAGIAAVRARIAPAGGAPPRLLVHARCAQLIEALERYHYDENRPDSIAPVKDGPDHAADALRYLIVCLDRPYSSKHGQW